MSFSNSTGRAQAFFSSIFLVLSGVVVAFLLVEMGLRFFVPEESLHEDWPVFYDPVVKPYVMFSGPSNEAGKEPTNSNGYRGSVPNTEKGENEYRVFVLGGSTVFVGNPPIPVLLEEQLKKNSSKDIRVFNYGVVSQVSSQELVRIVFEISDFQPDLIIMYNGGNDVMDPFLADPRPGYTYNFLVYENNPLFKSISEGYPTFTLTLFGSRLARYFFRDHFKEKFLEMESLREKVGFGSQKWKEKTIDIYVKNLVRADKVSKAFGAKFMAVFQPLVFYKEPKGDTEQYDEAKKRFHEYAVELRELFRDRMVNQSIDIHDFSDIFDGIEESVFTDPIHISQKYKPIVADKLGKIVEKKIRGASL